MSSAKEDGADVVKIVPEWKYRVCGKDVKGGAFELWRRYALVAVALDDVFDSKMPDGVKIHSITLRCPVAGKDDWLLVAKGLSRGKSKVAFHRGQSAADVVEDFRVRQLRSAVDWRDEKPWVSNGEPEVEGGQGPLPPIEGL